MPFRDRTMLLVAASFALGLPFLLPGLAPAASLSGPPPCTATDVYVDGSPTARANCVRQPSWTETIREPGAQPNSLRNAPQSVPRVGDAIWRTMSVTNLSNGITRATLTVNLQRYHPYGPCNYDLPDIVFGDGTAPIGLPMYWYRPQVDAPCSGSLGHVGNLRRWNRGGATQATELDPFDVHGPTYGTEFVPGSADPAPDPGYNVWHYLQNITQLPGAFDDFSRAAKVRWSWPSPGSGVAKVTIDIPTSYLTIDTYLITAVFEGGPLRDYFFVDSSACFDPNISPWGPDRQPGSWCYDTVNASWDLVLRIPKQVTGLSNASCTSELLPGTAGGVRFRSTSTDPAGELPPLAMWQAKNNDLVGGDDGFRVGPDAVYRFTKPGVHQATLTVLGADGSAGPVTCSVTVPSPALSVAIDYLDAGGAETRAPFLVGAAHPVPVRVTVGATRPTGAVGVINDITFRPADITGGVGSTFGGMVRQGPRPAGHVTLQGATATSPASFSLGAGQRASFQTMIWADAYGRFNIGSAVSGTRPTFTAGSTTIPQDQTVTAQGTNAGMFGDGVSVEIELDPPEPPSASTQTEGAGIADTPSPTDLHAKLTVTNTSGHTLHHLDVDVAISSTATANGAATAFVAAVDAPRSYAVDVTDQLPAGGLPTGAELELDDEFVFHVVDDVQAKVDAVATASSNDGYVDTDHATRKWKLRPKYLVALTWRTYSPADIGTLVKAGGTIQVRGTAKNLSNTDVVDLAPLYAELLGNATYQSFGWSTDCGDVENPVAVGPKSLQPRATTDWSLCVATSQSDARMASSEAHADRQGKFEDHSGGTRARLHFTPWATVTDQDGETTGVDDDQFKVDRGPFTTWNDPHTDGADIVATKAEFSIDDSIAIPEFSPIAALGSFSYGGVVGVKNGLVGLVLLPGQLLYGAYSSIAATVEFQATVWQSFTDQDRKDFVDDTSYMAAAVLMRNAEFANKKVDELAAEINPLVYQYFVHQQEEWYVGDAYSVMEWYGEVLGEQVDGVSVLTRGQRIMRAAMPIINQRLVLNPRVRRALAEYQRVIRTHYETDVLPHLASARTFDDMGDALFATKAGTELTRYDVRQMFAISDAELDELQKLADEFEYLLTVRSRHGSSIKWIEEGAELKPEALKIKTVSELDSRLGYREADIGSLVFRKPRALADYINQTNGNQTLKEYVTAWVDARVGTGAGQIQPFERDAAIARIAMRSEEWIKYEAKYKKWSNFDAATGDGKGWIDSTFNWGGNYMDSQTEGARKAFRMTKVVDAQGVESFELFLYNPVEQKWGRITGDIDPIAFTHLDGTPLTRHEHATLVNRMRINPKLQAQHPESATFVGVNPDPALGYDLSHNGPKFVKSQFKFDDAAGKMEGALQVIPGQVPRLVRFNEGQSLWRSPEDYKLHFDGGYVHAGVGPGRGDTPIPAVNHDWPAITSATPEPAVAPGAKPQVVGPAPTGSGAPTLGRCAVTYSTAADAIAIVLLPDGRLARVIGGADGSPLSLVIDDALLATCSAEGAPVAVSVKPGTVVTQAAIAGATRVEVPAAADRVAQDGDAAGGFAVGQLVVVGAGTDHAETRAVVGFGSLIFDRPLSFPHEAGEPIVVIAAAAAAPPTETTPTPTQPTPAQPKPTTPKPTPVKPKVKRSPVVTGTRKVGTRVTCASALWTGTAPIRQSYAWQQKVGRRWIAIRKANANRYLLARTLKGRQLRCAVTARNAAGSAVAYSKPVAVR